jgi:phospholipid/cholesterol/gamma-HCH transport system substrate-binding protein
MKRIAIILVALVGSAALLTVGTGAGGDEGNYEVRAIFGNAAFLVTGEEVRVAGANVGVVSDIDVTTPDEAALENGKPDPGKAVVVLQIDDPAFQDFRADAGCLIRPQSLIGEKFVECKPTQPRAAGTDPPPELQQIPDGQPGAGQYLLPLENNGTAVDVDLVNNIMKEPYPDRFRLILNSLGAGLAARGKDLAEIVERGNPALQETNQVLAILAKQNKTLSQLSADSDQVITSLAKHRQSIAGFINQSETVASASAERGQDLQESFARFPAFLRELRATMDELNSFATTSTPVFRDLGVAAPSLTRATKALGPFSEAGIPALTSLGTAAAKAGPDIVASDPVIKQIRGLAKSGQPATKGLGKFLGNLRKRGGYNYLNDLIYNSGGSVNAFDNFGHFLRALLPLNNCVDYETIPEGGCGTFFDLTVSASAKTAAALQQAVMREAAKELLDQQRQDARDNGGKDSSGEGATPGADGAAGGSTGGDSEPSAPSTEPAPSEPQTTTPQTTTPDTTTTTPEEPDVQVAPAPTSTQKMRAARSLMNFLIGGESGQGSHGGHDGHGKRGKR